MSLNLYRRPRLVVVNPDTPVLEAARAIENNRIGALVVYDKRQVVGIVTDRDLATRVIGGGLDPKTTTLAEVMTKDVATLCPSDSQGDAIALMQKRNIRRIPLVEDDRLVGIVTLDDLLLDEAAPLAQLAAVVQTQIGEGGPAPSDRSPARLRSLARAEATYFRLVNQVREATELESAEQAETALEVALGTLVSRLTPEEARDLIAQLPSMLQPRLQALATGPDKEISRQTVETKLIERLSLDQARAGQVLAAIGTVVTQNVSPGQMEDVRGQLPEDLREAFFGAPSTA